MKFFKFVVFCFISIASFAWGKTVEEVIPITLANLRGHKTLYYDGWFLVSSTHGALSYAHQESILESGKVFSETKLSLLNDQDSYFQSLSKIGANADEVGAVIFDTGARNTKMIFSFTHELGEMQFDFAQQSFQEAWGKLTIEQLTLNERASVDHREFVEIPAKWGQELTSDFSEVNSLMEGIGEIHQLDVKNSWAGSFQGAKNRFHENYVASGKEGNSISALAHIFRGYGEAFYFGLLVPVAKTTVQGAVKGSEYGTKMMTYPLAVAFVVGNRTVQAVGMGAYRLTKMGYEVVAPTLYAGAYASVGLLSAVTLPVTYVAGGSLGIANQTVSTIVTPVAVTAQVLGEAGYGTVKYTGLMTYDMSSGLARMSVHQMKSGAVLGYNVLTALPTNIILGAANTAFFAAYDGPRLAMAKAKGELE